MRTTLRCHHAFTLMELIAVVVILLALAALIFPVFARARENGRRAVCVSNLRQIGMAVDMYRTDYGGIDPQVGLPLSHSALGLPHGGAGMYFFETEYVKNCDILFCPSYTGPRKGIGSSYGWSILLSELTDPSQDYERIAAVRGPDYPIAVCSEHKSRLPRSARNMYEIDIYHVLRIDGRVDIRKAGLNEPLSLYTW